MHVKPLRDIPAKPVDIKGAAGVAMRIAAGPDHGAPNFTMRVFDVDPGGHTPRHSHPFEHEIYFLAGAGEVFYDGQTIAVTPGVVALIPPDVPHQFRNTGDEVLRFICVVPNAVS